MNDDMPDRPWSNPGGKQILSADAPRETWLEKRRGMLCASDVAAIMGVSNYGDQYSVWADKTGRTVDYTNDAQARGLDLEEAVIANWLNRHAEYPVKIRRAGLMQSKNWPRAGATVDRLSACRYGRCVVEAKTQIEIGEWGTETAPEVPVQFQFQGQWQLYATGRDHVHFVVMGPRFVPLHRIMLRDMELIGFMVSTGMQFWSYVETDDAPPATRHAGDAIKQIYGNPAAGVEHVLDGYESDLMHDVLNCKQDLDEAKTEYEDAVARLQALIGNATEILWPDRTLAATWRPSKTIDGADKGWRLAHPELVEQYEIPLVGTEVDVHKLVADRGLVQGLRYRRSFLPKPIK